MSARSHEVSPARWYFSISAIASAWSILPWPPATCHMPLSILQMLRPGARSVRSGAMPMVGYAGNIKQATLAHACGIDFRDCHDVHSPVCDVVHNPVKLRREILRLALGVFLHQPVENQDKPVASGRCELDLPRDFFRR